MSTSIADSAGDSDPAATLLIVDDDTSTRMMARAFLERAGFTVEVAGDGLEALERLSAVRPDLVLLDVDMPVMDGFETCARLRRLDEFRSIPVLMLTGLDNDEAISRAYEVGATDFASKPINWSLLCQRLRYLLRSSRAERRIQQLAWCDSLTGLPNRVRFNDLLAQAMADAGNDGVALLLLDLDDFKRVNDTLGHATGDALLKEAARRLTAQGQASSTAGERTSLARLGGDEFIVLIRGIADIDRLHAFASEMIEALSAPFVTRAQTLFMIPRVGIAARDVSTHTPEQLLRNADQAKCAAKCAGKAAIRVHDESMGAEAQRRYVLDTQLRQALERDELTIHYQPQLDLATGRIYACEALLRWTSGSLGPIYPDEFIPLAERNGCILEIGAWVLERACRDAMAWSERRLSIEDVAVNVSVQQFMQPGFAERVRETLELTGLAPRRLELEITESLLAADTASAVATLKALKRIGVTLSIDDFGTGYSSLSQLKHFPIDRIKIDRSFITDLDSNEQDATITRTIIAMGSSLGLRVLAEGVETEAQLQLLIDAGCNEIQGFWLGRPQPVAELIEDLERIDALLPRLQPGEPRKFRRVG